MLLGLWKDVREYFQTLLLLVAQSVSTALNDPELSVHGCDDAENDFALAVPIYTIPFQ
jgi:hypothetical protein